MSKVSHFLANVWIYPVAYYSVIYLDSKTPDLSIALLRSVVKESYKILALNLFR